MLPELCSDECKDIDRRVVCAQIVEMSKMLNENIRSSHMAHEAIKSLATSIDKFAQSTDKLGEQFLKIMFRTALLVTFTVFSIIFGLSQFGEFIKVVKG